MAEAHNAVHVLEASAYAPLRQKLAESDDFLTIPINRTLLVKVCCA